MASRLSEDRMQRLLQLSIEASERERWPVSDAREAVLKRLDRGIRTCRS